MRARAVTTGGWFASANGRWRSRTTKPTTKRTRTDGWKVERTRAVAPPAMDGSSRAFSEEDSASVAVIRKCEVGDALRFATLGESRGCFFEVESKPSEDECVGAFRGVDARLRVDAETQTVRLSETKRDLDGDGRRKSTRLLREEFTREFSGWTTTLERLRRGGEYPSPGIGDGEVPCVDVVKVCGFEELRRRVLEDPSEWADGSPKDFKGLSENAHATLNAGELLALMSGQRPMVMCQLWTGWEEDLGRCQNVDLPYVTRLLKEVTEDEDLAFVVVSPPGATDKLGLTALIYPNRSPYKERAKMLASFGAQAAIVAGSPYYQTLIGRCLGYKEEHIAAHVAQYNKGAGITKEVSDLVDEELAKLSGVPVSARWRDGYATPSQKSGKHRRGKKKSRRATSAEDLEIMFGRRKK
jgi:hypothetical protein